jgi:arsenite methyltransferase
MTTTPTSTCSPTLDRQALRDRVIETYDRLASAPDGEFHFHRGVRYAVERLGYDAIELASLPTVATDRFAGVGNPLALGSVPPGAVVLDHACGAGTDLLLAARRAGPAGRAIGVDLTPAMRARAAEAAAAAGLADRVELRAGAMEALPVADASVDVVVSNGVLNLSPDKPTVVAEIARVLKPGGVLLLADVVVAHELSAAARGDAELWAACVGGAVPPWEIHDLLSGAGLAVEPASTWYDCFAGTPVAARVKGSLQVRAMGIAARR